MGRAVKDSQRRLRRAVQLAQDGRNAEAEAAFREATRAEPDLPEAFLNLGVVLERQNRHEEAEQAFRRAIDLQPDSAQAKFDLGVALVGQARYPEAEQAYREAIEIEPRLAEAYLNLGVCLERKKQYQQAEAAYRKALEINPDLRPAKLDLASVLERLGRFREAEAMYRTAVAAAPDDAYVHFGLGLAIAKQRRLPEAVASYREAIRLKPDFRAAHSALALALDLRGELEQAIDEYRRAIALPVDEALTGYRPEWDHYKLARTLTALGREPDAETAFRAALTLRSEFPEALCALADLLNRRGQPEHAEEYARQATAAPDTAWRSSNQAWKAWVTQAAVCVELGEKFNDDAMFDEALAVIESARQRMPASLPGEDHEPAALLSLLRGYALAKLERPGEARSEFRKCAKQAPGNSAVALAAARNERRLNARLRNRVDVPRWLPYALSLIIVAAAVDAGWLVQQRLLSPTEFLGTVAVGVLLVFAAFSLPALTRLKVGPAELQKETAITTPPRLELLTASPVARVSAQGSLPDISLRLWTVATIAVLAIPGQEIKLQRIQREKFDYKVTLHGSTARFRVYIAQDVPVKIADLLLSSCERDYDSLAAHFPGVAAGPFNVILMAPPAGYHYSCGATDLYCGAVGLVNARITLMFCASQMVEVFAALSERGWNCGTSAGEGLSRVLAAELYADAMQEFVTASSWLDSKDRPDYVNKSATGDSDPVANGCAVLFLNYLHHQLGVGWREIVAAGGANLGETYTALTGKTDGFARFTDLMEAHFPVGKPSGIHSDNPFPFPDSENIPKARAVALTTTTVKPR